MAKGSVRAAFPFLKVLFGPFLVPAWRGAERGGALIRTLPKCRNLIALCCSQEGEVAVSPLRASLHGLILSACVHQSFIPPSTLRQIRINSV